MSTRHSGPISRTGALKRSLFGSGDSVRDRLSWREMQPILLRSAGLVGLAVAVVAVISKDSFVSAPQAQPQEQVFSASERLEAAGPAPATPAVRVVLPLEQAGPAATVAAVPSDQSTPRGEFLDAPLLAADAAPAEVAAPAPAPDPQIIARARPVTEPSPAAARNIALSASPAADRFAVETPEPRKENALWAEDAVDCPRDWVAIEDADAEGDAGGGCDDAAALVEQEAAGSVEDPALQEAVAERATEIAGLQFVPRIPQARPKAPPRKAKTRARGSKLGAPPNCGSKYAKWRYVNKVPTWYCK